MTNTIIMKTSGLKKYKKTLRNITVLRKCDEFHRDDQTDIYLETPTWGS
jgi:hypothetical protein